MKQKWRAASMPGCAFIVCLVLLMTPALGQQQHSSAALETLIADLDAARHALSRGEVTLVLDDPNGANDKAERDRVDRTWIFAFDGDESVLEREYVELSTTGLNVKYLGGFYKSSKDLYDFRIPIEFPELRPTSRVKRREHFYPNPRMCVEYAGVSYADMLRKSSNVRCVADRGNSTLVADGTFSGLRFRFVAKLSLDMWVLSEAAFQVYSSNKSNAKHYVHLDGIVWTFTGNRLLPMSARLSFADERNQKRSTGRRFQAIEWRSLTSPISLQTRIRPGSVIINDSDEYFILSDNGDLERVAAPESPSVNQWALVYLLSGTGLLLAIGFLVVRKVRESS